MLSLSDCKNTVEQLCISDSIQQAVRSVDNTDNTTDSMKINLMGVYETIYEILKTNKG